jgi:hypothetical protein
MKRIKNFQLFEADLINLKNNLEKVINAPDFKDDDSGKAKLKTLIDAYQKEDIQSILNYFQITDSTKKVEIEKRLRSNPKETIIVLLKAMKAKKHAEAELKKPLS